MECTFFVLKVSYLPEDFYIECTVYSVLMSVFLKVFIKKCTFFILEDS